MIAKNEITSQGKKVNSILQSISRGERSVEWKLGPV